MSAISRNAAMNAADNRLLRCAECVLWRGYELATGGRRKLLQEGFIGAMDEILIGVGNNGAGDLWTDLPYCFCMMLTKYAPISSTGKSISYLPGALCIIKVLREVCSAIDPNWQFR